MNALEDFAKHLFEALGDDSIECVEVSQETVMFLAQNMLIQAVVSMGDFSYIVVGDKKAKMVSSLSGLSFAAYLRKDGLDDGAKVKDTNGS